MGGRHTSPHQRRTRDRMYIFLTIAMGAITVATIPEMISSRQSRLDKNLDSVHVTDLVYPLAVVVCTAGIRRVLQTQFTKLGDVAIARKPDWSPAHRENKISRFSEQAYKFVVKIFITYFEWNLLQDQAFFPSSLLGSGDSMIVWSEREEPASLGFSVLYWIALGYNIEDFLNHALIVEPRSDYYEMIFHHTLATCLIIISYFTNHWRAGLLVLIVHDFPDIFAHAIKCSVDGTSTARTLTLYLALLASWGYCRLYAFPKEVIFTALTALEIEGVWAMVLMGFCLLYLHIYWYMSFLSMGLAFLKTGNTVDTQQQIIEPGTQSKADSAVKATPATNGHSKMH